MRQKLLLALAALPLALALGACGNKEDEIKHAETEGIYVDVGELKYQVQISRILNPAISEDASFLEGVEEELGEGETWFAVFLRVENESSNPVAPAETYELEDQQGAAYEPVEVPASNPFHFSDEPIAPGSYAPAPDSVARQLGSIGGMLLLYRVPYETLDNRPVELIIRSDEPEDEAVISIDI